MSEIAKIDAASVRLICSGQVVVDLASAVKELVENALDAGATAIEVRLVEYGAIEIECSDNGCGIAPSDFDKIVERYATSKLQDFEELRGIKSFGFRGEALSSLCELAGDFSVVTRCRSEKLGTRLSLTQNGTVTKMVPCARSVGTTVSVKGLFSTLPVRRVDFERNMKRHYAKALRVLHGYALIATHCRLRVLLQVGEKRSAAVAVQGGRSIRDGVLSLFGTTFAQSLEPFVIPEGDRGNECTESCTMPPEARQSAVGLVSRVSDDTRRSEGNRQFVFVNGRPISAPKVVRAVNEIWRTYQMKHKPAFVIDLKLPREDVDINVAPDKSEMILNGEATMLRRLKAALEALWEPSRGRFDMRQSLATPIPPQTSTAYGIKPNCLNRAQEASSNDVNKTATLRLDQKRSLKSLLAFAPPARTQDNRPLSLTQIQTEPNISKFVHAKPRYVPDRSVTKNILADRVEENSDKLVFKSGSRGQLLGIVDLTLKDKKRVPQRCANELGLVPTGKVEVNEQAKCDTKCIIETPTIHFAINWVAVMQPSQLRASACFATHSDFINKNLSIPAQVYENNNKDALYAAPALSTVLTKNDFTEMEVLGQFNLGFLICKLGKHLFIVDQHAADEKIRYERNWKDSKILTQPLLAPLSLELNSVDECILIEKCEIFERNGFKIIIDRNALISNRAKVLGVPSVKGATFGSSDVSELISIVADSEDACQNEDMLKLPKLHALFASKACRSAIMIGTALTLSQMSRLLNQLATLDQPWNCPHGRPTTRHLAHVSTLLEDLRSTLTQPRMGDCFSNPEPAKRKRTPAKRSNRDSSAKRPRQE